MEHKTLSDLGHLADFVPEMPSARLTRRERLEQWVNALEREPERRLSTLHEIEHKSCNERRASRVDNSPLTVAFENPALRADGLASDQLGDAMDYFELSDEEAHRAFCSCFYGESMTARGVGGRPIHEAQGMEGAAEIDEFRQEWVAGEVCLFVAERQHPDVADVVARLRAGDGDALDEIGGVAHVQHHAPGLPRDHLCAHYPGDLPLSLM